ncbi:AbrB/MazE/SpoVT family DNA-binding domain-containing protein [Salinirubellus salinus]|jgi:phosphate uptake regulator|uniref:AbrB/MazE/SpoVT family DNA-binding domain-containing protein n=1 Tax=Salinirubellus salinus TaxID=1364945 RepID=A0A9E7R479_9EURY|nr:phosphate uptake regulator PhoU [Salinirubellus salinus]UWM55550.1 AbrB/MazE/SpoVT family DNA-binding domain-containing protein [Salinirubellus salinus]
METRKVQVTGGSTYTVSLPKTWATDNGVSGGSVVEFHPEDDALLLTPRREEEKSEGTLDITGLEGEQLTRAVITMYVSGFDIITLETARVTAAQRRNIRRAAQGLVGLEVIGETSERVQLQDLLDSSELSMHNAITRMRLVATTMLGDAVTALVENDDDLAMDVVQRDDDVDRLWAMVSRVFRSVLRDPRAAAEIGLDRETCFDYHSSARQLERVADHATKIANHSRDLGEVPEGAATALEELYEEAIETIDMAMDALLEDESETATRLANDARENVTMVDEHAREVDATIRDLDPQQAQLLGLVVDSLTRSADYGGNIAETALQKAAPKP